MRNKIILLFSSLLMLMATFIGCTDIVEEAENNTNNKPDTRAITTDYYWYEGQKIGINKKSDKKYILFEEAQKNTIQSKSAVSLKFDKEPEPVSISGNVINNNNSSKLKSTTSSLMWATVETSSQLSLSNQLDIVYEAPYFIAENGKELGISHLFYVKLKSEKDISYLMELASKNKVEIIGNNRYMPLWYTLSCTKESSGNSLEMANKFYETSRFAEAQPDFMEDNLEACVNDTFFGQQWNLNNTGQNGGTSGVDVRYCSARSVTSGSSSIVVAVIDHGIQLNHPDLNVHPVSYNTETGTSPSVVLGNHGTACAGIIGARSNNSLGVAGIAPNCPLMSISNRLVSSTDAGQKRADGFNFAWRNGASVISNSWRSSSQSSMLTDAIRLAQTSGRDGKGCVVVFAAGNDNSAVNYPANAIADIIVVGAISFCGERKSPTSCDGETNWGSNFGSTLDIVAPGVYIPTTDLTGADGYSSTDYYMRFNGTSSACPHVAATAALVLSVNPNLTQKQVADIIEGTTRKIGGYSYATTSGRPNGTWNNEMGYGLLDTGAAVARASSGGTIYFNNRTVSTTQSVSGTSIFSQNVTVTNLASLFFYGSTITITQPFIVNSGSNLVLSH